MQVEEPTPTIEENTENPSNEIVDDIVAKDNYVFLSPVNISLVLFFIMTGIVIGLSICYFIQKQKRIQNQNMHRKKHHNQWVHKRNKNMKQFFTNRDAQEKRRRQSQQDRSYTIL